MFKYIFYSLSLDQEARIRLPYLHSNRVIEHVFLVCRPTFHCLTFHRPTVHRRDGSTGGRGWGVENKLKNEVKIHNFPHKMSIKSKNFAPATLVKQDQLIFIYSKIGAKSMHSRAGPWPDFLIGVQPEWCVQRTIERGLGEAPGFFPELCPYRCKESNTKIFLLQN